MRSGNPALNDKSFDIRPESDRAMTLEGTAIKAFLLIFLVVLGGAVTWLPCMDAIMQAEARIIEPENHIRQLSEIPSIVYACVFAGSICGFIVAMVIIYRPKVSPYLSPIYALLEGVSLGSISVTFEYMYPMIALQAVGLTAAVFISLLTLYLFRIIKATENFKLGVVSATGGICLLYILALVMGLFGVEMPFLHETGWLGIGISVFICIIAALNLVLDFDFIEKGVEKGAPKYMEWYGAFGLLVTLVWLYLEILRLLAKIKSK